MCFRQIFDHYTNMYPQLIQNPKTLVAVKRFMAWVMLFPVCFSPVFAPYSSCWFCLFVVSRTSGLGVRWSVTPLILCGFTPVWFWHSWTGCRQVWPTGPNNRGSRWEEEDQLIFSYRTRKIRSFYFCLIKALLSVFFLLLT